MLTSTVFSSTSSLLLEDDDDDDDDDDEEESSSEASAVDGAGVLVVGETLLESLGFAISAGACSDGFDPRVVVAFVGVSAVDPSDIVAPAVVVFVSDAFVFMPDKSCSAAVAFSPATGTLT